MDYSPKKMQDILNDNNFNFKKKFGQNFIIDQNLIDNIVELTSIDKDILVIEVGPGAGSLTYKLCKKAKNVICYEIDTTLKDILETNLKEFDNYEVIYNDFLKSNINENIKKYEYKKLYLVANLPYYITTPILTKLIEDNINIDKIVVMVQKEVGNRFAAKVGTKDYNSLSIFLNYHFNVKKILDVSRNVFIPKPNVDSIVVEFTKKESKLLLKNDIFFFKLVKDSFMWKRKTIKNNLKNYNLDCILEVLKKYNLDLNVRAEQIPIEVYVDIANNYIE